MKRVLDFWASSYKSDPIAFIFELISFVFTIVASLTLAVTAAQPNMSIVYPAFLVGSVTGAYAFWRRKLAWPLVLTCYFVAVNIFGLGVAVGWW